MGQRGPEPRPLLMTVANELANNVQRGTSLTDQSIREISTRYSITSGGDRVRIKGYTEAIVAYRRGIESLAVLGEVLQPCERDSRDLVGFAADMNLTVLPDSSPPASVLPSPPYTATESVTDASCETGSDPFGRFSSAGRSVHGTQSSSASQRYVHGTQSSSASQRYVSPHLRDDVVAAGTGHAYQPRSTALTSANLRSQEGGHTRARPQDDAISVATSAVSYNSTYHSRMRREQRSVTQREIQAALKHGWRDQIVDYRPFGSGIRFKHEYQGVVVITAQDLRTVISTWTSRLWSQVHYRLLHVFDEPDGSYRGDSLPASANELTQAQAMAFMRIAAEGCTQLGFPDVPTLLIDYGCGCLEQALQLSALAEPCWTPKQLAGALTHVSAQAAPHPRILTLLSLAVAGGAFPAPFPWNRRWELTLEELGEAIDACGGSVAACGSDMVNRNLLHLFFHFQNEAAVQLLLTRGGADLINSPNIPGRMPIFSAAGVCARDCVKATRLTRLLCEARCSVDWNDVNGRNILHHAIAYPHDHHVPARLASSHFKESRLEIIHLLVSQGANAHEQDRDGVSPATLAKENGNPLVAAYLNGEPVCMASVIVSAGGIQLHLRVLPTVPTATFTPSRTNFGGHIGR